MGAKPFSSHQHQWTKIGKNHTTSAQHAGYATLLIRDHFISEPFGDQFVPLAALMAAADATTTMTFMLTHHSAIFFFQALLELLPVEWIGRPVMILTFSLCEAFLLQ